MKQVIILLLSLSVGLQLPAQKFQGKHEVYTSIGAGTLYRSGTWLGIYSLAAFFNVERKLHVQSAPVFSAGYLYNVSGKIQIGAEWIQDRFKTVSGDVINNFSFTSILLRSDFTWKKAGQWRFSSGIAGGVLFADPGILFDDSSPRRSNHFSVHLYLINCDYSVGQFAVFLNTGIGASGFINSGLKFGF
jgi:hypothetical protein